MEDTPILTCRFNVIWIKTQKVLFVLKKKAISKDWYGLNNFEKKKQ